MKTKYIIRKRLQGSDKVFEAYLQHTDVHLRYVVGNGHDVGSRLARVVETRTEEDGLMQVVYLELGAKVVSTVELREDFAFLQKAGWTTEDVDI